MHSTCPMEVAFTGRESKLYVVTPVINPCRYASRYRLYRDFAKMVADSGGILLTVECAFGNRPHVVTEPGNPFHVQLRTSSEIWHKENLINIGISRLPNDWEYVAWIDGDVDFARPNWVKETLNQLQHFPIVQMFTHSVDLDPDYAVLHQHPSIMYRHLRGELREHKIKVIDYYGEHCYGGRVKKGYYAHPGYAWAARRSAIDQLGGLIDNCILGSADWHMAYALLGRAKETLNPKYPDSFKKVILEWEQRAERYIRRNVGVVPGTLLHHWHGKKKDRMYNERYRILEQYQFDPDKDLKRDSQGLYQLTERSRGLRDALRSYFRSRNEDSIDV